MTDVYKKRTLPELGNIPDGVKIGQECLFAVQFETGGFGIATGYPLEFMDITYACFNITHRPTFCFPDGAWVISDTFTGRCCREGEDLESAILSARSILREKGDQGYFDALKALPPIFSGQDTLEIIVSSSVPAEKVKITAASGSLYDGDHGMTELYEHRYMLFCVLANSFPVRAWKTRKHHDGSSYPGYFLAGMELPAGTISYHLPDKCWDLLNVSGKEFGPEWDGHTPDDVLKRLEETARTGNLWTLLDSTAPEKPAVKKCDCYPDPQNWLKCQHCGNPMFNEDLIDFKSLSPDQDEQD